MITLKACKDKLLGFKQSSGAAFGIRRLGVFGSVAREENRADSDVDIVVELAAPSLSTMYELRTALTGLLGCKVDLVRMRGSLSPFLKANIEKDAVYV